jgi:hypothetical protein
MLLRDRKTLWKLFDSPLKMSNEQYSATRKTERAQPQPIYQAAVDGGFGQLFGVNNTRVDPQHNVKLNTGFVYKCVNLRSDSQAVAMLEKQKLYWYKNKKEKEEINEHPYWDLLRYVNDQLTPYDLWKFTASSYDFLGYCPWWVETEKFLGDDIPVRINPLHPDMGRFSVEKNSYGEITGYKLHSGIKPIHFEPREIFFHTDVNVNSSTYGLGLVNSMVREANIDQLQKQKVMKLITGGGLQQAVITFNGAQGDEFKKAKLMFEEANSGLENERKFLYKNDSTAVDSLVNPGILSEAVAILGLTRDQIINLSGCKRVSFEATNKADALMQEVTYAKDVISPLLLNLTSRLSQDFVQRYYPQEQGWLCVECDSIVPNDEVELQAIRRAKLETGQARPVDFLEEDGKDLPDESDNPAMYKYYLTGGLTPIEETALDFSDLIDKPKAGTQPKMDEEYSEETES